MSRIQMLEWSLRCFGLGIIALIPVVGLPAALISIFYFVRVRLRSCEQWNAASPYLLAGIWLSGLGLFLSLVGVGAILYGLALA